MGADLDEPTAVWCRKCIKNVLQSEEEAVMLMLED